jgi:hypothetical protein
MKPHAIFASLLLITSCTTDPRTEILEIHPWSVQLIDHDPAMARVNVKMLVGPDGCHSYKELRSQAKDGTQSIRFFSEHVLEGNCTLALVEMDDTLSIARIAGTNKLQFTLASGEDTTMILK